MIIFYIYLGLASLWAIYLIATDGKKYLNSVPKESTSFTFYVIFYVFNFISAVLLFPYSFYMKKLRRTKQWVILSINILEKTNA